MASAARRRAEAPDRIEAIRWRGAALIGMGGFAVVFRVAPGRVAKVGRIEPEEVSGQRAAHAAGLGLEVLDFAPELTIPARVSRAFCPRHGPRHTILPNDVCYCACGARLAVLLMPEAGEPGADYESTEVVQVRQQLHAWAASAGGLWDDRPANLARDPNSGRLIGLDFGDEQAEQ
jgi:hypothetical protein